MNEDTTFNPAAVQVSVLPRGFCWETTRSARTISREYRYTLRRTEMTLADRGNLLPAGNRSFLRPLSAGGRSSTNRCSASITKFCNRTKGDSK